jgi:hypothetical protein
MNSLTSGLSPSFFAKLRKIELPWLILAALLASTLLTAYQNSRQLRVDALARFNEIGQIESRTIARHLHDYEDLLRGVVALAHALPSLDAKSWNAYLDVRANAEGGAEGSYGGLIAIQYLPASPTGLNTTATTPVLTRTFGASAAQLAATEWSGCICSA